MPKMKTNRAARKRFGMTAKGHVKRAACGASHFMACKRPNRLRRLQKTTLVGDAFEKRIKLLFPYGIG